MRPSLTALAKPGTWTARLPPPPVLVSAALGVALCAQGAVTVADWVRGTRAPPPFDPMAAVARHPRQAFDVARLAAAHLFGSATSARVEPGDTPATTLSLVLAGVIAVKDPAHGLAILGEAAKDAKVYLVGESVPGGARLHAVYTDRVILDRDGSLESLLFPRLAHGGLVAALSPGGGAGDTGGTPKPPGPPGSARTEGIPRVTGDIIATETVTEGGQQRGIRIYPGRKRALFSMLGLAPGDLVTAIDGSPLTDPNSGKTILATLDSSSSTHFTVLRNGHEMNLLVDFTAIAPRSLPDPAAAPVTESAPDQ